MTAPPSTHNSHVYPELSDIDPLAAADEVRGNVVSTPMRRLPWLERLVGVPVWAKLECYQHTGSFKYRGAYLATLRGPDQPLIAASAGNHGLAVAEVAARLGRTANICIPVVASRLKRERILATGAGLIEYGNSLEDATRHAQQLAAEHDLHYISPYNNPQVVAGSSTIAVEMLREQPALTTIVAPVGGGGLVAGLALGARAMGSDLTLIGCEPERYASVSASLSAGQVTRVVHQPTFADGLAVNLEPGSITLDLVRNHVADLVTLAEEELAAATYALLVHESLLVEPAGAASVIACLRLAAEGRLTGPVGIPLCGGNVAHTTLSRIQGYPYSDPDLIRLLDLRGRTVEDLPVRMTHPTEPVRQSGTVDTSAIDDLTRQLAECRQELAVIPQEIEEHIAYCARNGLVTDQSISSQLSTAATQVAALLAEPVEANPTDGSGLLHAEGRLRFGLATLAYARGAQEWCSPSYDQSRMVQFFNTGAQDSPTVNYERYEGVAVQRVEAQLQSVLDLRPDVYGVTATSSGMASYSLVEAFLMRWRLRPGDTVLLAPYLYFEAEEQLNRLPFIRCVRSPGYRVEDLIEAVRVHQPRCVFADPLANTAQQRMVDIPALLAQLRKVATQPVTLVVDGTMVSGALGGDQLISDDRVEVIYYESCSKYLQLGFDASMAGLVAYPVALRPHLERLRRNLGAILARHHAEQFPRFDRELFRRRMQRISANAERLAHGLAADLRVSQAGQVFYPGHPGHPDASVARQLPYAGGCVTFLFQDPGRNHRDELEALQQRVLSGAQRVGLPLTKGVSFGFTVPRISAASSMAETEPPFLRIYAGALPVQQTDVLVELVADAITG